jgi:hypothetical protein
MKFGNKASRIVKMIKNQGWDQIEIAKRVQVIII